MKCPKCGCDLKPDNDGFIEIGEWRGNSYEEEFSVYGYCCPQCGIRLWVTEK